MGAMLGIPHRYLTSGLPGVGGTLKGTPEDFFVEEVPLYPASGAGEHAYIEIEKTDLSTFEALERLGRALGVHPGEFGYAGLKDRKGVTRQRVSVAGVPPERVRALEIPQLKVLSVDLHTNKLRVGHLRGNRFRIRVRGVAPQAEERARRVFEVLLAKGLPNYFGQQRFGNRGDAHIAGRSLLREDWEAAVRRILGHPAPTERNPEVVRAREAFARGDYQAAWEAFPGSYREEKKLLQYILKAGENWAGAAKRLGGPSRKIYLTAYQSFLFNVALSRRLERLGGDLGRFVEGDIAYLHRNAALFRVEDLEEAAARARRFEISPSGPIFGKKMLRPRGLELEIEEEILRAEGLRLEDFHKLSQHLQLEGGRRPFRVRIDELSWSVEGSDLLVSFFLPKGSYATVVLRELMKDETVPEAFYEGGDEERHRLWRPEERTAAPG